MKFVVGLGNPGGEYAATRHNVGFMVVDELARRWEISSWRTRETALVAEYRGTEPILLIKPQTYMNLSGTAVGALARWYKVSASDIIVVYDDLDLAVGRLRLRTQGSSGGHRGIESIIVQMGSDQFNRVRVGIGRPPGPVSTINHVLGRFTTAEIPLITGAIERAAAAVDKALDDGFVRE
jgi:PTH1 family peptidyl-tRNA hydrolase